MRRGLKANFQIGLHGQFVVNNPDFLLAGAGLTHPINPRKRLPSPAPLDQAHNMQ